MISAGFSTLNLMMPTLRHGHSPYHLYPRLTLELELARQRMHKQ
jgi:hypothetical protein